MQLQELKKELDQCQAELNSSQTLLAAREVELQKIEALKEEWEKQIFQMHQLKKTDPAQAEELQRKCVQLIEQISQHKQNLKKIDDQLDHIGEEKELHYKTLKQTLIRTIHELYPESAQEFATLTTQLEQAQKQKDFLTAQRALLLPLFALLQEGARLKTKGGLLDFLLGRHPKPLLARVIAKAGNYAEKINPHITEPALRTFFDTFLHETRKTWNKELYRGHLTNLFHHCSDLLETLNHQIETTHHTILTHEHALHTWLTTYSSPPNV